MISYNFLPEYQQQDKKLIGDFYFFCTKKRNRITKASPGQSQFGDQREFVKHLYFFTFWEIKKMSICSHSTNFSDLIRVVDKAAIFVPYLVKILLTKLKHLDKLTVLNYCS